MKFHVQKQWKCCETAPQSSEWRAKGEAKISSNQLNCQYRILFERLREAVRPENDQNCGEKMQDFAPR